MHKMSRTAVLAMVMPLAACVPSGAPDWLIQPADPNVGVRAPRYTTVTTGVRRFDVVEPKDWLKLNREVAPKGGSGGMGDMDHSKMPGMDGKSGQGGMEGMPGMGKPKGGESMDHSKMPGMNMPGMGDKRDTGGR